MLAVNVPKDFGGYGAPYLPSTDVPGEIFDYVLTCMNFDTIEARNYRFECDDMPIMYGKEDHAK